MPWLRRWVTPCGLWIAVVAGATLNFAADYFLFQNSIIANLGDRLFAYWLCYVFAGVAFARGFPRTMPSLFFIALILLAAAPFEFTRLIATDQRASPYLIPTVTLGSLALLLAVGPRYCGQDTAARSCLGWMGGAFAYVGRRSLVIFVGNPLLLESCRRIGFAPETLRSVVVGKAVLVGIAIAGSLLLDWILRRIKLGVLVGA
jgi:hypothetical protein